MNTQKRTNYVDMIKGLAILNVVCYHLLAANAFKNSIVIKTLFPLLASFFILAGYFYKPGKRTFAENVKSRAESLLIPFVKYGVIFWLIGTVYLLVTKQAEIIETLGCLRNFFAGAIWNRVIQNWFGWNYYKLGSRYMFLAGFWFLPALFFACVVFFAIADRVLDSRKKTLAAVILLFAVTGILRGFKVDLPYNLQLTPYWAAFLLLGTFSRQEKLFELPWLSGVKGWCSALIGIAAGLVISFRMEPVVNTFRGYFPDPEVLSMILSILSALLFVWGLGTLFRLIEESGCRVTELAWLGSHSLTIYLYHYFYAWALSVITGFSLRYPDPVTNEIFWKSAGITCAALILSILTAVIEDRLSAK